MTVPPVYPRPVYIYALLDPETDEVRYVGRTDDLKRRLKNHLLPANLRSKTHKNHWIRDLRARGLKPLLKVLEVSDEDGWRAAERRQIAAHRAAECRLTNLTDGGWGSPGRVVTAQTRAKLARANTGRVHTPQTRAKISAANRRPKPWLRGKPLGKGRKLSPEHAAAISRSHKGKPATPGQRAALARCNETRVHSAATRQRISEAAKRRYADPAERQASRERLARRPFTAEERARASAALRGKPQSPELIAKRRAGLLAYYQRRREEQGQLCLFTNRPEGS